MEQKDDIKSNNFTLYYRCILCQLCRFMDSKTIEVKLIVMIKHKFKKDICSLKIWMTLQNVASHIVHYIGNRE